MMRLTWLGHSGFRLEAASAVILIDPWLHGNPAFPENRATDATAGATHLLVTHGHFDHVTDAGTLARDHGLPLVGQYDLVAHLERTHGLKGAVGFNKGGTVDLGGVRVTMVNAVHSSSHGGETGPVAVGSECGYMIAAEDEVIYLSGDTDIMADMGWMAELHRPTIGILCAGGHFTMDMARAGWAARRFFDFRTVIPCHYDTFDLLRQDPQVLRDALPGVDVRTPSVMETITL